MKGELWQIVNDYEPDIETALGLAGLQQLIQEHLNEVYSHNESYPHFLERKENFHEALRATIRKVHGVFHGVFHGDSLLDPS